MHELICVGCGPGDPELLTIKAVNAIKNADIILCPTSKKERPSIALSIISTLLLDQVQKPHVVNLVFPMTRDRSILKSIWKKNSKIIAECVFSGKNTVYITVGDPYLYSTWIYLHRELSNTYPQIRVNVIPGIVSIFTFAAKAGISIAEAGDKIAIIPSCYDLSKIKEIAKNCDNLIFLKDGRYFDQVLKILQDSGFSRSSMLAIGQELGTKNEIIIKTTLDKVNDMLATKYFSIMMIKRA